MKVEFIIGLWIGFYIYCLVHFVKDFPAGQCRSSKVLAVLIWMFFWAPFVALIEIFDDAQLLFDILLKPEKRENHENDNVH